MLKNIMLSLVFWFKKIIDFGIDMPEKKQKKTGKLEFDQEKEEKLRLYNVVKDFIKITLPSAIYNWFKRNTKAIAHQKVPIWFIALSAGMGAFIGCFPTLVFKIVAMIILIWLFRFNLFAFLFGLIITGNTLSEILLYPVMYTIGAKILNMTIDIDFFWESVRSLEFGSIFAPLGIGTVIVGIITASIIFAVVYLIIYGYRYKLKVLYRKKIV